MTVTAKYPIIVKENRKAPYDDFKDGDDELEKEEDLEEGIDE